MENVEWHDSENTDQIFKAFADGRPEYPVVCPDCGEKSGHIYINRYKDSNRGGAWAWCSKCHSYGHYSYLVPVWWHNHSCVDQEKLCAANPDELAQYEATLDDLVNSQLARYCMSDNVCQYCIRKEYENPKIDKCPECGNETLLCSLDGASMLLKCSSCGFEVIGASFFPHCMNDDLDYTITVSSIDKDKKIKVSKVFELNVMDLLRELNENGQIRTAVKIFEAVKIIKALTEIGVQYTILPDLMRKYPDLIECKYL